MKHPWRQDLASAAIGFLATTLCLALAAVI
jgi:hypothetical protein